MNIINADAKFAGKLCSICQTKIIIGEDVVKCSACELPFHHECWQENKGCSAYGCTNAPATEKKEVVDNSVSWNKDKKCPSCFKLIKAKALKCHYCKAEFDTTEEVSVGRYSEREYTDDAFTQARNKIIALFLLSMTGFLSPFMLVIVLILIYGGSFWGVEFKRMPAVLKIFSYICMGLNIFLILILILLTLFDS
jgi:hypothetical protein